MDRNDSFGFFSIQIFSKLSGSFRKHQLLSESMHAARFEVFIMAVAVVVVEWRAKSGHD